MAGMAVRALNLRPYADRVLLSFLGAVRPRWYRGRTTHS